MGRKKIHDLLVEHGRILWIDVARGIGILLVVLGHTSPPFMKYIYGFHMPLFFIISGFLYTENIESVIDLGRYVKKSAHRYLMPYFILCLLNLVLEFMCYKLGISQDFSLIRYLGGILYSRGTVQYMPNCSPLWFLTCLFCAMVLFSTLRFIIGRIVRGGGSC